MQYFIDTNIFLRVLVKDQEKQFKECVVLLKLIKENKIKAYTSTFVLAEIVWTLGSYYSFGKEQIIRAIKSIVHLHGLKIEDKFDSLKAIELYKHNVKFIDCLIASDKKVQTQKTTVVSYDRDFIKLQVLRKEPSQIIKQFSS